MRYLGHGSVLWTGGAGVTRVIADPYDNTHPPAKQWFLKPFPDVEADIVLITHDLRDALSREFVEETTATARFDHLIALDHVLTETGGWWLYALLRCRIESGVPSVPDTGEIAEVLWVDPQAPPSPLTNAARKFLSAANAGHRGVVGWLT